MSANPASEFVKSALGKHSDIESEFSDLCDAYDVVFGERIGRGFGMPEDVGECCKKIRAALVTGIECDPSEGIPRDAIL